MCIYRTQLLQLRISCQNLKLMFVSFSSLGSRRQQSSWIVTVYRFEEDEQNGSYEVQTCSGGNE